MPTLAKNPNNDGVDLTRERDVHVLRFTRPEALNTLTLPVILALDKALIDVARQDPQCLLITAEGANFMAGGDLTYLHEAGDHAPHEARVVIDALNSAMRRLMDLPCPTVIAVQGAVAGAGLSLTLACDMAIGMETTRFVFAYDKIAATPDGGLTWTLPRVVGLRQAIQISLSGRPVDAARAETLGLLAEVTPANELQSRAETVAAQLASGPTDAYVATRKLMHDGQGRNFTEQLDAERDSFCQMAETGDFRSAVGAFFARRTKRDHDK